MFDVAGLPVKGLLYNNDYPATGNDNTREFYSTLRIARSVMYPVDMSKKGTWKKYEGEPSPDEPLATE